MRQQHNSGLGRHIVEVSRTHSIRHTHPAALQRTRDQFLAEADTDIKQNKLKRRTTMPSAEFEPVVLAIEQPYIYVLCCSRTLSGLRICSVRGTFMQIRNKNHFKNLGNIRWWWCPVTEKRALFSVTAAEVRPQNCIWRSEKTHLPKGCVLF